MALILIVDDSPTEVFQMRRMLENHGFETEGAADGAVPGTPVPRSFCDAENAADTAKTMTCVLAPPAMTSCPLLCRQASVVAAARWLLDFRLAPKLTPRTGSPAFSVNEPLRDSSWRETPAATSSWVCVPPG